jgi:hypothetical protein
MLIAGTSFPSERLVNDLPLLAPLGGCRPLGLISFTLRLKPNGQLRFVNSTFNKVYQVGQGAIRETQLKPLGSPMAATTQSPPRSLMSGDIVDPLVLPGQFAETAAA